MDVVKAFRVGGGGRGQLEKLGVDNHVQIDCSNIALFQTILRQGLL